MLENLEKLCGFRAVSGNETEISEYIKHFAGKYCCEVKADRLGNIIAFKKGIIQSSKKIMLAAHMDEVGIIIKRITDDGMLKFAFVGGVDTATALSARVLIGDNKILGVIGSKAVHLCLKSERETEPKEDSLYIDIGADSRESAQKLVSVGDYGTFDSRFTCFEELIKSRALDDRIGCAVLMKLMTLPLEYDVTFAFTVQEEVGLRGAFAAAFEVNPDIALIIETTACQDVPLNAENKKVCKIGGGAVISFMDKATIYDKSLFSTLCELADKNGIKWQTKSLVSGGNDAGAIHKSRGGVKCANVSVPVRYIHSQSSVASAEDCNSAFSLCLEFVQTIGGI